MNKTTEYNPTTMYDNVLKAQNAYKPTYDADWRGINTPSYSQSAVSQPNPTVNNAKNIAQLGTAAAVGAGFLTGGTGFLVAGIIEVAGGILGSIFGSKPELTPEQKYFNHLVNFYHDLGKKSKIARNMTSMLTGKPADSYIGKIGYKDGVDAFKKRATFDTGTTTTAKKE